MAPTLEERVSRLEGLTDGLREQLSQIHRDLKAFEERVDRRFEGVDRRFEGIDRRFEGIDRRFNWIIGLMFTSWITLMMAILLR